MHTARICTGSDDFYCLVEKGKKTAHPSRGLADCIPDERVPSSMVILCLKSGAVIIETSEATQKPPRLAKREVTIRELGDQYLVTPALEEADSTWMVSWPSNWVDIKCDTEGQAERAIELLEQERHYDVNFGIVRRI